METETTGQEVSTSFIVTLPYTLKNITANEFSTLKQAEPDLLHLLKCTANPYWRPHFAGVNLYIDFELTPHGGVGSVYIYVKRGDSGQGFRVEENTLAGAFHFALMGELHKIRAGKASI